MYNANELASYYFHQGTNFRAYEYMGCTHERLDDGFKYVFRVWAPNALEVGLISDFSGWDEPLSMHKISAGGVYECEFISQHSLERFSYKFRIKTEVGVLFKGDPVLTERRLYFALIIFYGEMTNG